ncbi:MAG TPA: glutathione S-transferase N-terminal domain-containing protein [Castellaniella sp.]|uniref:glutathione S-transferase family protein n=1 Tax=Castellaniella sp. TaxID=1955812 RepID=UPI002EEB369B
MKLYYFPGACPLATHIVLEWIGKPYEAERLTREQTKEPAYLKLNPAGAVPTLVDGDFVLTQSAAILEYLAELHPEAKLMGDSVKARAETRRWLSMCNSDIHRTFGLVFGASYFAGGDDAIAQVLAKNGLVKLQSFFKIVNDRLKGRDWLTGHRSVADSYLFVLLSWADAKKLDLSGMDDLRRFQKKMSQDKGVQAALKAQGLI